MARTSLHAAALTAAVVLSLWGCAAPQIQVPQPAAAAPTEPELRVTGAGRRQLMADGSLWQQQRLRLANKTTRTIWVPQALWLAAPYEPDEPRTLEQTPSVGHLRALSPGGWVDFHRWQRLGAETPPPAWVWYKQAADGAYRRLVAQP